MLSQRCLRLGSSTRLFSASRSRSTLKLSTLRATAPQNATKSSLLTHRHHFSTSRTAAMPRAASNADIINSDTKAEAHAAAIADEAASINILEETANQEFLKETPIDTEDRLRRAVALLLQIILYLGIPRGTPEQGMQFLMAFGSAPVGSRSEIARARRATATILLAVIRDINSIPEDHPLRAQAKDMFDRLEVITLLSEAHLVDPDRVADKFREFWPHSQDHILQIMDDLNAAGYGMDMEELQRQPEDEKQ